MIYRNPILKFGDIGCKGCKRPVSAEGLYYLPFARHGLLKGLEILGVGKDANLLVPGYICKEAVAPLSLRGVKIKFYKIKKDFSIDFIHLNQVKDKDTAALVYVNYFGLQDGAKAAEEFCKTNGLYLIEDNAHVLFPNYENIRGDISIFSLRKFYPIPDGAVMVVRDKERFGPKKGPKDFSEKDFKPGDYRFILGGLLRKAYALCSNVLTNRILLRCRKMRDFIGIINNRMPPSLPLDMRISKLSCNIIGRIDAAGIINRRRENYGLLLQGIRQVRSRVLEFVSDNLSADCCPLAFPLIVTTHRQGFLDYLFTNGFIAYSWPDMPDSIIKNRDFVYENLFYNNLVLLPLHQDMEHRELRKISSLIRRWAEGIDGRS